jgi:hypothetical protein
VIFQDAAIHGHRDAGGAGARGGGFVDDAFLHPHSLGLELDGSIHERAGSFRAAEDVDDVDGEGNRFQRGVGALAEHLALVGVHRHDAVALRLHVLADAVAWPPFVARQAYHGDGLRREKHGAQRSLFFAGPCWVKLR